MAVEGDEGHANANETEDIGANKLSHRKRKALLKKQRRKERRQAEAQIRDEQIKREEEADPAISQRILAQEEARLQEEVWRAEQESKRQHELWLFSEARTQELLRLKKEKEEWEKQKKEEIERKIKEEWEERQKKEKEEEEERKKKKEKQDALLKEATAHEHKDGQWHNPLAPANFGKEQLRATCPFFAKTGACRFGESCSRAHPYPDSSCTLMFPNMYSHFTLDQGLDEEYDLDIVLEYEENEVYQNFKEFYEDIVPEFKKIGRVTQVKVCCNCELHLRGNVYIQFRREEDAQKAFTSFNGRWYGGRQLSCQFVDIEKWKKAICGTFLQRRCTRGKNCNFLHVFKNPGNEFWEADKDFEQRFSQRRNDHHTDRRRDFYRESSYRSRHSRSRSPRSKRKRSRSRSEERHRSRRRSRSPRRSRSRRYSRSRSRSFDRRKDRYKRSRSRSESRSRSKSTERYSKDSRYTRRSRSKSEDRKKKKSNKRSQKSYRKHQRSRSKSEERKYSREPRGSSLPHKDRNGTRKRRHSRSDDSSRSPSKERSRLKEKQVSLDENNANLLMSDIQTSNDNKGSVDINPQHDCSKSSSPGRTEKMLESGEQPKCPATTDSSASRQKYNEENVCDGSLSSGERSQPSSESDSDQSYSHRHKKSKKHKKHQKHKRKHKNNDVEIYS